MSVRILRKGFNCENNKFQYITGYNLDYPELKLDFNTFSEFKDYFNGDIRGSDLYEYDFKDISVLKNLDLTDVQLNDETLKKLDLFDTSSYERLVSKVPDLDYAGSICNHELTLQYPKIQESEYFHVVENIAYISDLHLDYHLFHNLSEPVSLCTINRYIDKVISVLASDFQELCCRYLLIAGDISSNFDITSYFLSGLSKNIGGSKIIFVIGNHELWDNDIVESKTKSDLDDVINRYRDLAKKLEIVFLQNDLLAIKAEGRCIVHEKDIFAASDDEIRDFCSDSKLTILGGIGFSGLNLDFNANHGIYNGLISRDEEVKLSLQFEKLYQRIKSALSDDVVIILTHMPIDHWSAEEHHVGWIYLSGHTHKNVLSINDKKMIYSDNQIGYRNNQAHLKCFNFYFNYNIFRRLEDGIHKISREEYLKFNRGMGIQVSYNKKYPILLLKNSDIYCFLAIKDDGNFALLNGGVCTNLKNDADYYYDKMVKYGTILNKKFNDYFRILKKISDLIQSIGGSGIIHGCIVDVDFNNHVYLNPFDGTLTSYFAYDMIEKYTYSNFKSMLYCNCPLIYDNFIKLLGVKTEDCDLIPVMGGSISEIKQKYTDTDIYKFSRILRKYQYFNDCNIIRVWNEELLSPDTDDDFIWDYFLKRGEIND